MTINSNNTVGVFIYHSTLGIHTEGTHLIAILFGTVYDLTLV